MSQSQIWLPPTAAPRQDFRRIPLPSGAQLPLKSGGRLYRVPAADVGFKEEHGVDVCVWIGDKDCRLRVIASHITVTRPSILHDPTGGNLIATVRKNVDRPDGWGDEVPQLNLSIARLDGEDCTGQEITAVRTAFFPKDVTVLRFTGDGSLDLSKHGAVLIQQVHGVETQGVVVEAQ